MTVHTPTIEINGRTFKIADDTDLAHALATATWPVGVSWRSAEEECESVLGAVAEVEVGLGFRQQLLIYYHVRTDPNLGFVGYVTGQLLLVDPDGFPWPTGGNLPREERRNWDAFLRVANGAIHDGLAAARDEFRETKLMLAQEFASLGHTMFRYWGVDEAPDREKGYSGSVYGDLAELPPIDEFGSGNGRVYLPRGTRDWKALIDFDFEVEPELSGNERGLWVRIVDLRRKECVVATLPDVVPDVSSLRCPRRAVRGVVLNTLSRLGHDRTNIEHLTGIGAAEQHAIDVSNLHGFPCASPGVWPTSYTPFEAPEYQQVLIDGGQA